MIVDVSIAIDAFDDGLLKNGLNLKIDRCDNAPEVGITLQNYNEENIFPTFEIDYDELRRAVLKLEYSE